VSAPTKFSSFAKASAFAEAMAEKTVDTAKQPRFLPLIAEFQRLFALLCALGVKKSVIFEIFLFKTNP
jgi:hypothetical protein